MLMTGLSGNEIYCLAQKGSSPGNIVVGNSVHSLGLLRGITSGLKTLSGGEIHSVTQLIVDGRHAAINRLEQEASDEGAQGLTGVASELRKLGSLMEFIAHRLVRSRSGRQPTPFFSTACSGQDLFCQLDSGYEPRHFVMGNVAYALGIGRGITGGLEDARTPGRGQGILGHVQPHEASRPRAAGGRGGRAGLQRGGGHHHADPPVRPGVREMLMVGTGSYNPALGQPKTPYTSELTGEELWNLTQMGYAPLRLVLGTSVYALGLAGGISAFFRSFGRGEIDEVTRLVYDARENCLEHIRARGRGAAGRRRDRDQGVHLRTGRAGSSR